LGYLSSLHSFLLHYLLFFLLLEICFSFFLLQLKKEDKVLQSCNPDAILYVSIKLRLHEYMLTYSTYATNNSDTKTLMKRKKRSFSLLPAISMLSKFTVVTRIDGSSSTTTTTINRHLLCFTLLSDTSDTSLCYVLL